MTSITRGVSARRSEADPETVRFLVRTGRLVRLEGNDTMVGQTFDGRSPAPRYEPSGWFSLLAFWPLLAARMGGSLAMGVVLYALESKLYIDFVTPAVVGLPVAGAIWALVRLGHCRNPLVGKLAGLTLGIIYYVGYWEFSYLRNVVAQGPKAVADVQQIGGAPGLLGYVSFRCKTTRAVKIHELVDDVKPPDRVEQFFNYFRFGAESVMVSLVAVGIGGGAARRIYYEDARRWSSKYECSLPPAAVLAVLRAIEARNWAELVALPRMAGGSHAGGVGLWFNVEYLEGSADEPAYITLLLVNMSKAPVLGADGATLAGPRRRVTLLHQVAIDPASVRALAAHFPDIKLAARAGNTEPAAVVGPGTAPTTRRRLAPGTDFREPAVAATRELLDEEQQHRAWAAGVSSCLPTGDGTQAIRSFVFLKYKTLGWMVALFTALFLLMHWGMSLNDPRGRALPLGNYVTFASFIAMMLLTVGVFVIIFAGPALQKRGVRRRLARRPGSFLASADGRHTEIFRLQDANTYRAQKTFPDDVCLCLFDDDHRRVLVEGVTHRYVIRAEDVVSFWPLETGESILIRLEYQVGQVPLGLMFIAGGGLDLRRIEKLTLQFADAFGRDLSATSGRPTG